MMMQPAGVFLVALECAEGVQRWKSGWRLFCPTRRLRWSILLSVVLCAAGGLIHAQQRGGASVSDHDLPNAPGRGEQTLQATAQQPSAPQPDVQQPLLQQGTGSISGIVLDINDGEVGGAQVTLVAPGRPGERVVTSGGDGRFTFTGVPAGHFNITITAPGLQTFVSSDIALRPEERHELPRIALPIAFTSTAVSVVVTQTEVAQEQLKGELQQRAFGILPNFYSSYIWDAAPLSSMQKFHLAFRSISDPASLVLTGVLAGVEQARNTFPGYGQGAQGYGKRYGAAFADDAIGRMLGSAVLPTVLHQDPRYFYKGSGTKKERALYAIKSAIICKGDNGRMQPNYSYVLGAFAAGGISNLYHSADDRGAGLTIRNGFLDLAGHAADDLIREFVLRRITPNVPAYESGKPE